MKNTSVFIFFILLTALFASSATYFYMISIKSQTSTLAPTSSPRFQPGLEKLNYLYTNQAELISESYFVLELKGKIKSASSKDLIIESNGQEFSVDLSNKNKPLRFYDVRNETSAPKSINYSDFNAGDKVKVQIRINHVNGNTEVLFVTKIK